MPWDEPVETEIVPIHAALVPTTPTGEIVFFAGFGEDPDGLSFAWRCDPTAGEERIYALPVITGLATGAEEGESDPVRRDLFCSGHAHLGDGRWLVVGGTQTGPGDYAPGHQHGHGGSGIRDTWAFLPRAGVWRKMADMNPQPDSGPRGGGRWYPTCVTLANGRVLAFGGHPIGRIADMADTYALDQPAEVKRHNNNIPEVYVPGQNRWLQLRDDIVESGLGLDEYNRLHLAPSGHVFFSTEAKVHQDTRLYDPDVGRFANTGYGSHIDPLYDDANCSAVTASVLLPLLHGDPGNAWVLVVGAAAPERLNLAGQSPNWIAAGDRQPFPPPDDEPPRRNNLHAILLPTGQVFVAFGVRNDTTDIDSPEMYTPAIDWETGRYQTDDDGLALPGQWQTLTGSEQSQRRRGYHSVAVLQPDGSVWAGGSTHGTEGDDQTDPADAVYQRSAEVYRPNYGGNRPTISASPLTVSYGEPIQITMDGNAAMHRVALVRCGSFTHAFDSDQRYLTLPFQQQGATITAQAPASANLAPPGYYLLYVLRDENTPSIQGRFIRLAQQDHFPVLQLSTYSLLSVRALRQPHTDSTEAVFADAIDLNWEGFLPHELNVPTEVPEISFRFTTGSPNVPGMRVELVTQDFEVNPGTNPDTAQRFRYVYDVVFENEDAFDTFDDDQVRFVELRGTLGGRTISVNLTLMKRANPFMRDGDPAWLSKELRIHKARVGDVNAVGGPQAYVQGLLDAFENHPAPDDADHHPFEMLDTSQDDNPVVLAVPEDDDGIYNFAVARVRFLSVPGENADGVKVFFRLFNTVGTALEYNDITTYRTLDGPGGRIPGLGKQGVSILSIPFFAEPRVTPDQAMDAQQDNLVNRRTLFGAGPDLVFRYFGCWLDVNSEAEHFPRYPKDDGPYGEEPWFIELGEGGGPRTMLSHIAGYHQCLVAEIQYDDDPTQPGQTPFTSDNLAQRNLATVPVANPGLEVITRTAQTTMDVKPSDAPTDALVQAATSTFLSTSRRVRADELVVERNDLPPGTTVEIYLPDVDIEEVLTLSSLRNGPPTLRKIDDHTVAFELGTVAYVALPGGRELNIASLLSVTLPMGILAGQVYTLSVKQYSGRTLRWVGAFELKIPVGHGADLLDGEEEKLSILRYIFEGMPERDRWHPVFERYLDGIGERVRGFGGDPDAVGPSPHGTGRPGKDEPGGGGKPGDDPSGGADPEGDPNGGGDPHGPDVPHDPPRCVSGKICHVEYDCFGDLDVFVVEDCHRRRLHVCACKDVERVVLMAWRERLRVTVHYRPVRRSGRPVNVTCPWSGKPIAPGATARFEGMTVGFCSTAHRDRFVRVLDAARGVEGGRDEGPRAASPGVGTSASVNAQCPWSGRPVLRDAIVRLSSGSVGFCSSHHHDRFLRAVKYFREIIRHLGPDGQPLPDASPPRAEGGHVHDHGEPGGPMPIPDVGSINMTCPWTRKLASAHALTTFEGHVVGFNHPNDRDEFQTAASIAGAHWPVPVPAHHGGHGGDHGDHSGHGYDGHGGSGADSSGGRQSGGGYPGHEHPGGPDGPPSQVNAICPLSGKPARPDLVAEIEGRPVGFCSARHRDEVNRAAAHFRASAAAGGGCDADLVRLVLDCC